MFEIGIVKSRRDDRVAADYVVFPDGTMVTRWRGDNPSTVVWASQEDAIAIHEGVGAWKLIGRFYDPDLE